MRLDPAAAPGSGRLGGRQVACLLLEHGGTTRGHHPSLLQPGRTSHALKPRKVRTVHSEGTIDLFPTATAPTLAGLKWQRVSLEVPSVTGGVAGM